MNLAWRLCRAPVRAGATIFFDLKCFGLHRIPKKGGVLLLSNHQSYLDPPFLSVRPDRPTAFLAKSELFKFKPFGALIRQLNAFPVQQGRGDIGAMKESIRLLEAGWMLTVFPEGSRSKSGELMPAQKGAGLMVRRVNVPVVPAVIDGAYRAWPRGSGVLPQPTPVRILYGEPVDLGRRKPDDIRRWIDDTLARMLDDLRAGRVP